MAIETDTLWEKEVDFIPLETGKIMIEATLVCLREIRGQYPRAV